MREACPHLRHHGQRLGKDVGTDNRWGVFSGGSHGFVVRTCNTPEAAVGGPIALVRDGDTITIDAENRKINVDVSPEELEQRKAAWTPPNHPAADCWLSTPQVQSSLGRRRNR